LSRHITGENKRKISMYDKLQLTNFDFIYDANDRQLKSKRSYSKDGNAVSITKS